MGEKGCCCCCSLQLSEASLRTIVKHTLNAFDFDFLPVLPWFQAIRWFRVWGAEQGLGWFWAHFLVSGLEKVGYFGFT